MRRTHVVVVSVALGAASFAAAGTVASARAVPDPPGTVVLASGPSAVPDLVVLAGVTPRSVVFVDRRGVVLQKRHTSAVTVLRPPGTHPWYDLRASVAGSFVLTEDTGTGSQTWFDEASGRTGTAPGWDAVAPTGGLYFRFDGSAQQLTLQNASTGATSVLADFPWSTSDRGLTAVSGPDGVLVYHPHDAASGDQLAPFVAYVPYSGGGVRAVDLGAVPTAALTSLSCAAPTTTALACVAGGGGGTVLAAAVPGAGGSTARVLTSGADASRVALSATSVGWIGNVTGPDGTYQALRTVPLAGGPVTSSTSPAASTDLASDGASLFEVLGSTPADAGVYSTPDAATAPSLVAAAGIVPATTVGLAIAPGGRVVYSDNRRLGGAVWQRTLRTTTTGIAMSPEQLVATDVGPVGAVGVSGLRTVFGVATAGGPPVLTVTSPLRPPVPVGVAAISGNRGLSSTPDGHEAVVDLNTGGTTSTAGYRSRGRSALWGDYLTFDEQDQATWRQNLAVGGPAVRVLPAWSGFEFGSFVAGWGDWIAENRQSDFTFQLPVAVYDVRTAAKRHDDGIPLSAGAAGYVLRSGDPSAPLTLHSWDGAHAVEVDGTGLVSTATVMAWIGRDGRPRAAPVPWTTPDPPRSLGNPLAPATVARGGSWTFDLPTSAPLTTCHVDLLQGATLVRALPCAAAYRGGGDAVVTWDTLDAHGVAVAPGAYTWRVTASNADGPLQLGNGAAGTVSGRLTVTAD